MKMAKNKSIKPKKEKFYIVKGGRFYCSNGRFSVDYKKAKLYSTKVVAAIINKTVQGEVRSTKKWK